MAEPIGFYTAKRRPSGPPPRQFSYQDHFHSQPNINYDPHGWHDPNQRAWTPETIPNGNTRRVPLNRLKSQDPPHQEPIWPGTAPADDPFDYRFTPVVVEAPVTLTQAPVESAYPKPQQNRNSEPDMPRNYYPDDRYINPPNKRYANPPDDRYINPQNNRYSNPPDDRYINPPNNRYASPPDDRYINPPDPRVRRAQTPDNLDNDNRMRRARTPDNLDNDSGYYAPQPQKQYRRPKTPDDLDGPAHPRDRYDRARTPDALGDRVYPPRQVHPDRARRAATPDNLDGRPPRAPPMDQQRRAHTIDNSRPPRHPDNRYKRASTPDMLDDKPRYHTLDNRPPLVRQAASTPEPRYPDNRQPLATRPDPYQRANTPDDLNGYPKSPRPDYTNRKQSLQPPTPRMQRAPSVEPYYELDPYGHALSTDNLDDVWGQMMQGNQDYENFDFDLVMTACKHNDESTTVRVDRVTRDQVDITKAHHIGDGPFKDIIINQATRKLPEVDEPEIKMKYLVHMKDKRKEIRELRYWFKPYINDDTQTDNAKEYFKTLLQPEQFPRDYVGYIKKALVLVRNFPMVSRLEIAMYPPPNDFEKRASFIDVQEEQIVVDRMQPLMDPATYGQGGPGGLGGWGGSTGSGLAFRDSHGPDLFAKVKQGDGREYYKDTADDTDDDIDYDQIIENFITVLTPNVYDYQYLPEVPVSDKSHIVFQVKAKADAHIALSSVYGDTDRKTYEVVIGGWNNNKSCIRYGGQGDIVEEATTFSILSGEELRRFWISWDRGLIQVGEGRRRGADTFLRYKIPENKQFSVNCLAVSTGQDSKGEWEFVELIRPPGPEDESKSARRARFRTSLLWLAKKQRMLQFLEDAYPNSMNTPDLLALCKIKLHDMMTAVVMLRDLQTRGLITEVSKGIWMRSPGAAQDKNHDVKMVDEVPDMVGRDIPTVAIITGAYCEKLAVDAMMDFKTSYVHYKLDGESQVYTIGRIGAHQVVSTKLSRVGSSKQATIAMGNTVTRLLGIFAKIEHIIVVGVAGGVPDFQDFNQHVRLGDIVVSVPEGKRGFVYAQCDKFETKGQDKYTYDPRYWSPRSDTLYSYVKKMRDMSTSRPWEKYIEEGKEILHAEESNFYRPAAKNDKLYALVDNEMVQVQHPRPPSNYDRHREENKPRIRYGPIAGGRYIARNFKIRMDFAMKHNIKAYDTEFAPVLESIEGNRTKSYLMIRGIADYVDGQKNKDWQPYAALAAASYMKALLVALPNASRR